MQCQHPASDVAGHGPTPRRKALNFAPGIALPDASHRLLAGSDAEDRVCTVLARQRATSLRLRPPAGANGHRRLYSRRHHQWHGSRVQTQSIASPVSPLTSLRLGSSHGHGYFPRLDVPCRNTVLVPRRRQGSKGLRFVASLAFASYGAEVVSTRFAILIFGAGHPAINYLLLLAIADDALGMAGVSQKTEAGASGTPLSSLQAIIAIAYPNPAHPVEPVWCGSQLATHSWPKRERLSGYQATARGGRGSCRVLSSNGLCPSFGKQQASRTALLAQNARQRCASGLPTSSSPGPSPGWA